LNFVANMLVSVIVNTFKLICLNVILMSVVADMSDLVMTRNLIRETVETVIRPKQFYKYKM